MLDDETNKTEWSKHIARLTHFAQETALGLELRYNDTVWFPVARNALKHYMEVRATCISHLNSLIYHGKLLRWNRRGMLRISVGYVFFSLQLLS